MQNPPRFEAEEDIECPTCERQIPIRANVCPHCETELL